MHTVSQKIKIPTGQGRQLNFSGQAKHAQCAVARGVWGHAPPAPGILDVLRAILMRFGTLVHHDKVHVQIDSKRIVFKIIESPIIDFRVSCSCKSLRYTCCVRARTEPHPSLDLKPAQHAV